MDRWVYASRTVRGRPTDLERILQSDMSALLAGDEPEMHDMAPQPATAGTTRHSDGSVTTPLRARLAGINLSKDVRCSTGVAYRRLGSLRIPVRWVADSMRRTFPSFDGYLEFEHTSRASGLLTLVGKYRPPFGPIGVTVDALGMNEVASNTATALVERLAVELERRGLRSHTAAGDALPSSVSSSASGPRPALRVGDVMTPDPILLDPDMSLRTAAKLLLHFHISGAPVVRGDGELLGVVSESDLLVKEAADASMPQNRQQLRRHQALTVGQACSRPARTTHPDVGLREAADTLLQHHVSRLVVVEHSRIVGIVTRHDILRALTRTDGELELLAKDAIDAATDAGVDVDVQDAVATLRGQVDTRSQALGLIDEVHRIDGIMACDSQELTWAFDDLALEVPLV